MTDKKQTEQKELIPTVTAEQAEEKVEKERQKDEKREAIQEQGVIDRTSKKLEVLEEINLYTPDTVTAEEIRNINVEKVQEDAEVKEALQLVGTITVPILAKLAEGDIDLETFDTPLEFRDVLTKINTDEQFKKVREKLSNPTEQATIAKLQEMFTKPESRLYKNFEAHWGKFMGKSREVIKEANDGIKGAVTKSLQWVKGNPGKAVIFAAGAYALYKIFTRKDDEKEKSESSEKSSNGEKKDWTDHIFNKKNGLALGILTIGALLGSGKLSDWIKKQLFGNTQEIALRAAEKAKEAAINAFNKHIDFDATKNRLSKLLPQKPKWLETAKLQNILQDMGIDPEKTAHLEKYSGPSGAALLLKDWITRKHKVDSATQKILENFLEKEKQLSPKETTTGREALEKEYGEFVPFNEAAPEFGRAIEKQLFPLYEFIQKNPELFAAGGLFLLSFGQVRDAISTGFKKGFNGFVGLAKIPFKTIKGFPLSSLFLVSAALLAEDQLHLTDAAGRVMVPKDPENLKKFISHKLDNAGPWIEGITHIPKEDIDKAVQIMHDPKILNEYIGPAEEMIESAGVGTAETLALTPKEVITKANEKGLQLFLINLEQLQKDEEKDSNEYEHYSHLIQKGMDIQIKVKGGKAMSKETFISELQESAEALRMKIFEFDGYIAYTYLVNKENIPITKGPYNILVDPSLDQDSAVEKAQTFVAEDTLYDALNKPVEIPVTQLRLHLDKILFKDIESEKDAQKIIERKMNSGATIVTYGGRALLYESIDGVVHKYALGPFYLLKHLMKGVSGDFSCKEFAVDYANGILPVFALGVTSSMMKGKFLEHFFSGRILAESIAYPYTGTRDLLKYGAKHILPNLRKPNALHAIAVSPALKVKNTMWAKLYRTKHYFGNLSTKPYRETVRSEFTWLAKLNEAKAHINAGNHDPKNVAIHHEAARESLEGIDIGMKLREDNVEKFLEACDKKIIEREAILENFKKYERYNDAAADIKAGKTERAKKKLEKLGYDGALTEQAVKAEGEKTKQEILKEVPQSRFEESELSPKEKEKLMKNIEGSKKDLEKLGFEYEKAHQAEVEKLTDEGIKAGSPEYEKRINAVKEHHAEKVFILYKEKGLHNLDLLDDATLKKHGFDPQKVREGVPHLETKIEGHGKIKKFGKGVIAFAAGLLAMYGISKGLEWFHEEDKGFDLEKLGSNENPDQKKPSPNSKKELRENIDQHKEALAQIQHYFSSMELDYQELNTLLGDPKKLKNTSSDTVKQLVQEGSKKHEKNIEKIKKYVKVNRDAFLVYYERLPKAKEGKDKMLSQFFSIGFDSGDNRPYLKYADATDFRDTYYEIIDMYRENIDKLVKGEKLDGWDTAAHGAKYAAPLYGTYLDGRDTARAMSRGEWASAAKSGGWCIFGAVSDALMAAGVVSFGTTTVAGGALKGVRVASAGTKGVLKGARAIAIIEKLESAAKVLRESEKLAAVAKFSHTGSLIGMGADIGRQIFIPPKSQTYYF